MGADIPSPRWREHEGALLKWEVGHRCLLVKEKIIFVGDKVNIDAGPLEGFDGVITELNDIAQKAKVTILIAGRATDVEVEYIQIKKIVE